MAKKTVKIDIPIADPDELVVLCLALLAKHIADGAGSPLNAVNMATFQTNAGDARDLRQEAKQEHALGEQKNQQAAVLIGKAKGQNSKTPGTLYNTVTRIRDSLLVIYNSNPERLSLWGFNVQVRQSKGRRKVKVDVPVSAPDNFLNL